MRAARFHERASAFLLDVALVGALGLALGLPVLYWAALLILYALVCHWLFGRTPGKLMMRLRIVPGQGSALRLHQALLRPLLYVVEIALLCGGFLLALVTRDGRTLHDMLLDTRVVRLRRPSRRRPSGRAPVARKPRKGRRTKR